LRKVDFGCVGFKDAATGNACAIGGFWDGANA
jgi:hypothetical protein